MENDFLATEKKFKKSLSILFSSKYVLFSVRKKLFVWTKIVCPARWMGHNIFAYLNSFWPHSSLTLRNHNIRLPSLDRVVKNRLMPHLFCPIQNDFCPSQNIFVLDTKFCPKLKKSTFLLVKWMENNFLVMEKSFPQLKVIFYPFPKQIWAFKPGTKNFCPGQFWFCPGRWTRH